MIRTKNNYYNRQPDPNKLKEKKIGNKVKTAGYTIKRLKDNGFVVFLRCLMLTVIQTRVDGLY